MDSHVKIVADELGTTIHQSENNPEYGYIRLVQDRTIIDDESGFLRIKQISTLLHGTMADLKMSDFKAGATLPGKLLVQEAMEPFNKKSPEREIKRAGLTGIVLKKDGMPIYRRTIYSTTPDSQDILIKHDNKAELQEAYAKQKEVEDSNIKNSAISSGASSFNLDVD